MNSLLLDQLLTDLLIVLAAGLVAGAICKRTGVSLLVGYLIVGAIIGEGVLGIVSQQSHELEYLAEAGALLLLFAVGIEFSLEQLIRMTRYFLLGGATQMLLVAVPIVAIDWLFDTPNNATILAAAAVALSSTVLVFKALAEWGQTSTPHGRRAVGILLFQDVALLPLMLLVPLLTGKGEPPTVFSFALLGGKSLVFVIAVVLLRRVISQHIIPLIADLRSVELIVLFALSVLGGACYCAYRLDLAPAIGALAAGLMLSGNRLSQQIDTIVLPFRETFAVVFFVTLGTLLNPRIFFDEPLLLTAGMLLTLVLKSFAATIALRLTGLSWRSALGMGLGLAQMGEFSFLLLAEGAAEGVLSASDYNRLLFIALGTLIATPLLMKFGLRLIQETNDEQTPEHAKHDEDVPLEKSIIIGCGPTGRQIASRLETAGIEVCIVDLSPVNLYPYSQQGFQTIAGDARDPDVLKRTNLDECHLAVVCVPDDRIANQIIQSVRAQNKSVYVLVRCRYQSNIPLARQLGAQAVISEEQEASGALLKQCDIVLSQELT